MCERRSLRESNDFRRLCIVLGLLISGIVFSVQARSATLEIPLALDYRILEQALQEQVFSGPGGTAAVYSDKLHCNTLVLSDPRAGGTADGLVRFLTSMHAQTGIPMGGKCRFAKDWRGLIETLQTAKANTERSTITFKIVDSSLLRLEDQRDLVPRFMKKWIRDFVNPRLSAVSVDLGPAVSGIEELLGAVVPGERAGSQSAQPDLLSPVVLAEVRPGPASLVAVMKLDTADAPAGWAPPVEAPLNPQELAQWDATWQAWDAFATWMIKSIAASAGPAVTQALGETLLEARYDLRDALAQDTPDRDPVRALFLKTWSRLAPLLHRTELKLPGSRALQYATFISAGDALQALDSLAPHLGMRLDRDSLRSLARVLSPGVSDYDLRYDTAVDPGLRSLLGLEPELELEPASIPVSIVSWLIRSAWAAQISPELIKQLTGWVPRRTEIDSYLQALQQLLDTVARFEHQKGKVPQAHLATYDLLLRATALQESCWRQYVEQGGGVQTIRSSAGSVGLMQINVHVWRGVYDLNALSSDIGYNARAGNEILVHYLVDYAIRKNEYDIAGEPDSLARATYAVYNGGPRQLTRYRDPDESASLKTIDSLFWQKYRAFRNKGLAAVKQCLAG